MDTPRLAYATHACRVLSGFIETNAHAFIQGVTATVTGLKRRAALEVSEGGRLPGAAVVLALKNEGECGEGCRRDEDRAKSENNHCSYPGDIIVNVVKTLPRLACLNLAGGGSGARQNPHVIRPLDFTDPFGVIATAVGPWLNIAFGFRGSFPLARKRRSWQGWSLGGQGSTPSLPSTASTTPLRPSSGFR